VNTSLLAKVYLGPRKPEQEAGTTVGGKSATTSDEQERIDAAIAAATRRQEAERQRLAEERALDRAFIEARLKEIQAEQDRDRQARAAIEQQQRRQLEEVTARIADMRRVVVETDQINRARALTREES
jgi:DNA primase